jgi:putative nucleotidyltransferase with HDIG domain
VRVEATLTTRAGHLTRGFFGALRAREPDTPDRLWAQTVLTETEFECWEGMSRADHAESIVVARAAARELGRDADVRWLAAALLHDVGKGDARLGPVRRAGATAIGAVVSHGRARRWQNRVGLYIAHDDRGAVRLREAGARPEVAAWAGAHHRREMWPASGIPPEICEILAAADNER